MSQPAVEKPRPEGASGSYGYERSSVLLEVHGLTKQFGGLTAVRDFSMTMAEGELLGLIGPNGAGKTTVFNLITGIYAPTSGRIIFKGHDITAVRPFRIYRMGIARTFQNIRLFGQLTVLDNVRVAYSYRGRAGFWDAVLRTPRFRSEEAQITERALELLSILGLEGRSQDMARSLPYGEQRRLEIARALAAEPKLLLLDEPAAGMNPAEISELMDLIQMIKDRFRLTILLIEHQMKVVMSVCERVLVMEFGELICFGRPEEVQCDERVIEAYLGSSP